MAARERTMAAKSLQDFTRLARAENDPAIRSLVSAAMLSDNPSHERAAARLLSIRAAHQLLHQLPFTVPRQEQLIGSLATDRLLGLGFPVGAKFAFIVPIDALTTHCLVVGASGAGKTNLLTSTALQGTKHTRVWIIDRAKGDYASLAAVIPDMVVIDAQRDLAWNPLEVHAGLTPEQATASFLSVFCKSFSLMVASELFIRQGLDETNQARGVLAGGRDFGTLETLLAHLTQKHTKARNRLGQYFDTVQNRLAGTISEAPRTYAYTQGFPIQELANRNIVFQVGGLNEHHARFLILHILHTLFLHRLAAGEDGEWLRNLVIVDEAAWFAPPQGAIDATGWSPLADILRMGRQSGIGLILASQTTNLDDAALENSRMRMVFRIGGGGRDFQRIATALHLDDEQIKYVSRQDTGMCVVSVPEATPFAMRVPRIEL